MAKLAPMGDHEPSSRTPRTSDPSADPASAEAVGALLETVRSLLAEENEREQSLNTRGVGFAGFVAIVLSITTALGHTALSSDWGSPWKGIAVALYAIALVALLASVIVVVTRVLRPQTASSLAISEVKLYPTAHYLHKPQVEIEAAIMGGLIDTLSTARELGQRKALGLRHGCQLLIVGLSCIATLGFLVGLHDANLIDTTTHPVKPAGRQNAGRQAPARYPGARA
jgi:uncharacterized membrane protein YccF (DUF307 family)